MECLREQKGKYERLCSMSVYHASKRHHGAVDLAQDIWKDWSVVQKTITELGCLHLICVFVYQLKVQKGGAGGSLER